MDSTPDNGTPDPQDPDAGETSQAAPPAASRPLPPPYVPPALNGAPSNQSNYAAPGVPDMASTPPAARFKGLVIAALVVSGVAFLSGWIPVFGAIIGAAGVTLGLIAFFKRQPKVLAVIAITLGGLALVTSIMTTVAVAVGSQNTATQEAPEPPPAESPSAAPVPSATPFPTASVAPEPVIDVAEFALEAHGHVADINKDLDDMVERTTNAQMIRLLGNTIELSFNRAQLDVLEVPPAIADEYAAALSQLGQTIDVVTAAASDYSVGSIDVAAMYGAIDSVRAQAAAIDAIVSKVG